LELEFEQIDQEKNEVLEVEEMRNKEDRLLHDYIGKKDEMFTSAHLKAGRKILHALKKLKERKATVQKQSVSFESFDHILKTKN